MNVACDRLKGITLGRKKILQAHPLGFVVLVCGVVIVISTSSASVVEVLN